MPDISLSKFLVWKLQRLVLGELTFCALFRFVEAPIANHHGTRSASSSVASCFSIVGGGGGGGGGTSKCTNIKKILHK